MPLELHINLAHLHSNLRFFRRITNNSAELAAVVKSNAYGLGIRKIVPELERFGVRSFFTATISEAIQVRSSSQYSEIFTLNGFDFLNAKTYKELNITPVINNVLEAQKYFNNDNPMMIANCDQYIDFDINNYLDHWQESGKDGYIMTMKANDSKWSYVGLDKNNEVDKVIEKEVISDEATVGIYNFKKGRDFIKAANKMIKKNDRVNNEFYVAPVYNYMIENKLKVGYFNIGSVGKGMHGLGTPEDLEDFINNFKIQ